MDFIKSLGLLFLTGSLLGAQSLPEDPVMKARTQRAQAQGINEADLPPVPRSIMEPPPLPPPEIHRKDTPGGRASKASRKAVAVRGKRATGKHSGKQTAVAAVQADGPSRKAKPSTHKVQGAKKSAPGKKAGKRAAKGGRKRKA